MNAFCTSSTCLEDRFPHPAHAYQSLFIGDPEGGKGGVRENDDDGQPCSSCGEELLYDRFERFTYCVNDWYHG